MPLSERIISERIIVDPEVLAGKPVVRGTRAWPSSSFSILLAAGQSENEIPGQITQG